MNNTKDSTCIRSKHKSANATNGTSDRQWKASIRNKRLRLISNRRKRKGLLLKKIAVHGQSVTAESKAFDKSVVSQIYHFKLWFATLSNTQKMTFYTSFQDLFSLSYTEPKRSGALASSFDILFDSVFMYPYIGEWH